MTIPTSPLSEVAIGHCREQVQPSHIEDILIKQPLSSSSSSASSSSTSSSTSSSPSPSSPLSSPLSSLCSTTTTFKNALIKPWQCCSAHHLMLSTSHLNLCFAHFPGGSSTATHAHPFDNVALSLLPGVNAVEQVYATASSDPAAAPKTTRTFSVSSGSVFTSFAPHYHRLTAPKGQALAFVSVEATLPPVPRWRRPSAMPVVEMRRRVKGDREDGEGEGWENQGSVQVKHLQSASFYSAVEIVATAGSETVLVSFDRTGTAVTQTGTAITTEEIAETDSEQAQQQEQQHNADIVIVARLICKLRHSFDHLQVSHDCGTSDKRHELNTSSSNSSTAIRVDRVRRTFKHADMETFVIHGFADMGAHDDVGVTRLCSSSKGEWSAVVIDLYAQRG